MCVLENRNRYLKNNSTIDNIFKQKEISISRNLIFETNNFTYPIYAGWPSDSFANIYAINGISAILGNPLFVDAKAGNFHLRPNSPAVIKDGMSSSDQRAIGALPPER